MGKKILPALLVVAVIFTITLFYNIKGGEKTFSFKVKTVKSQIINKEVNSINPLSSDTNQKLIERTSICVIDFMRNNSIELLGRETLVSDPHFIIMKYDFDQHLRLYLYLSKDFKIGLLDSVSYPNIVDQIYTSNVPGVVLDWPASGYNLTTAVSSDFLNNLPEGLVKKVNNNIPLCLATL